MLIVCPSCATSYEVDPVSVGPSGRQVRCVRCRTVWRAELSRAEKLRAAAAAIAPGVAIAPAAGTFAAGIPAQPQNDAWSAPEMPAQMVSQAEAEAADLDEAFNGYEAVEPVADLDAALAASAAADEPVAASDFAEDETLHHERDLDYGHSDEIQAPPIVPVDLDEADPAFAIPAQPVRRPIQSNNVESVAARRRRASAKRGLPRWPLTALQSAILVLIVLDMVVIGWRNEIVRVLPQTASFYAATRMPVNLRGLVFDNVTTSMEQHEGVPILVVQGSIVNDVRHSIELPRLKFLVRNAAREEIYTWTVVPPRAVLPSGEAVAFRTRLASPPPETRDVLLRFFTRRDVMSGSH